FLEKGFYLFRSEQHFGIAGHRDRVALFPRSDRDEILRLMGTNGWNYDIGPDSVIAWLRTLERDHPFVLTGIGFDWVEGRFRSAIGVADGACLLLLHLEGPCYPTLRTVLVYPHGFVPKLARSPGTGQIARPPARLIGESWGDGVVVISWDDAIRGARSPVDGDNVVLH